jgi:hypothetical protein
MRPLQAHCHLGLGTLYGQAEREQPARAALGTAIELYQAMEMTFWLPRQRQRWRMRAQLQRHERIEACGAGSCCVSDLDAPRC